MEKFEPYFKMALDSFLDSLPVIFKNEYIYKVLLDFGKVSPSLTFIIVLLVSFAGSCVTWFIGKSAISWAKDRGKIVNPLALQQWETIFNKYLKWLLLFSWASIIGNPVVLAAGILNTGFKEFALLVLLGKAVYYYLSVF